MSKKKIMVVFGTRPECIKMIPIIKALENRPIFDVSICNTAQHTTMVDQILEAFGIVPHHNLGIMQKEQTLTQTTIGVLQKLSDILSDENPDIVLVQGDTSTTFVAGLASYYQQIPLGHVEAGLRTYNKYSPFPEEINRRMTSALADYHFATTEQSRKNLAAENVPMDRIFITGNTVIDCLFMAISLIKNEQLEISSNVKELVERSLGVPIVLITAHRRESFGSGLQNIFAAIRELSEIYKDHLFVYPVHLNPNVKKPAEKYLGNVPNLILTDPLDYFSFVYLMDACHLIMTDSGGIQEEAPSLGKPILVMRERTERPEGIEAGVAKLTGVSTRRIVENTCRILDNTEIYAAMASTVNPYGDGNAASRIMTTLERELY